MTRRYIFSIAVLASLAGPGLLMARQSLLKNGSMEWGQGAGAIDPQIADLWTEFGQNVERSGAFNLVPAGEGHSLKAFGDGTSSSAGANQVVTGVAPGQQVVATVSLFTPADDKLLGSGEAGLVLEFLNSFGGSISLHNTYVLDSGSTSDTWIPATIGPLAAPAGTTKVRVTCRLQWTPGNVSGAAYWDDANLTLDAGANQLSNGDFEQAGPNPGQSSVGIDDWFGFDDQEKSSDVAEHGLSSLKLGIGAAYSGLYQDTPALDEGEQIVLLARVWNPSGDPLTSDSRAGLKLEFEANTQVPPPEENLPFDPNAVPDQWTLVTLNTTVPAGATIARIVCIYVGAASVTGSVHFDSVFAERGSAPAVNQLLNASFETGGAGENAIDDWTEFWSAGVSETRKSCFVIPPQDGLCTARAWGEDVSGLFQEITVTPGESLDISAYLYTPISEQLTGPAVAGIKVEWAVGGVPPDIDIGGAGNTIDAGAAQDTWIPLTIDFTMPAGANALTRFVTLIEKGSGSTGRVYFDSCEAVVLNRFDGADADADDDQDLLDFAGIQRCYSGAGGGLQWNCLVYDSDDDSDVDDTDWGYFWPRFTGPN